MLFIVLHIPFFDIRRLVILHYPVLHFSTIVLVWSSFVRSSTDNNYVIRHSYYRYCCCSWWWCQMMMSFQEVVRDSMVMTSQLYVSSTNCS